MKKIIIILLFIFITGCDKYTELDELSILKSIGITYHKSYTLYAEILDDIKKNNEPKTIIIEANGKTINEAFHNLKELSKKEIFLSHIDLLILDINLNNKNYQEIIDYFLNNKSIRNDFNCIFSKNIKKLLDKSKYDEIENYLKANKENKKIINISFDEVINYYLNNLSFNLSLIDYDNNIVYKGNYRYLNNSIERIKYEEN